MQYIAEIACHCDGIPAWLDRVGKLNELPIAGHPPQTLRLASIKYAAHSVVKHNLALEFEDVELTLVSELDGSVAPEKVAAEETVAFPEDLELIPVSELSLAG